MAFDFGAAAGGVASGIEQGQQIRERYRDMIEKQQVQKANALAAQVLAGQGPIAQQAPIGPGSGGFGMAGGPQGTPPITSQGAPPPMGGGPPPGQPMGGGAPPPQVPPKPMPMPGAQPMPQAQAPQQRPPMQPPQGAPQGQPPQGGGGAPPADSGPFAGVDWKTVGPQYQQITQIAQQHYQQTIQQVVAQQKQNGGKPDPLAAMQAADEILAKQELDPTLKMIIQAQAAQAKSQMQFVLAPEIRANASEANAGTRADASRDVAGINAGARTGAAEIGAGARRYAADQSLKGAGARADASRYGADQGLKGREYSADQGAASREYGADQSRGAAGDRADASMYAADQGRAGRENAASITAGQKPSAQGVPRPVRQPLAAKGAAPKGGVPVPSAFASDPDGKQYHKDGKVYVKRGGYLVPQGQ